MVWTVIIVLVVISVIDYSLLVMSEDDDIFAEDEDLDAPWEEEVDEDGHVKKADMFYKQTIKANFCSHEHLIQK